MARWASAARVSVGLYPVEVTNTEESHTRTLSTPHNRCSADTTDVAGSDPMRAVPMTWRDAGATPSGLAARCTSRSPCGGEVALKATSAPASVSTASWRGPANAEATSSWGCGA